MTGNATYHYRDTAVLSVTAADAPIVVTSAEIDDQLVDPPEQYWRVGAYLREATTVEDVDDGVELTFHHRPLGRYVNAAGALGLRLERLEEPPPPTRHLEEFWNFSGAESIPRLAVLVFRSS